MTPPVAASSDSAAADVPRRKFSIDSRFVAPIFISLILIVADYNYRVLEDWRKTALAIIVSIVTEIVLGLLFTKKVPHLASAYVSGISCGILIRSPEWWPYILAGAISITSKYVIRVNGRHLWNPSNFAIAALLFIAPQTVASLSIQWGNDIWPMLIVWTLGSIIVYRLKRFHICAAYVASFFFYAYLRTLFTGHNFWTEVAPITGPMYQLFVFFMITDPKTTTQTRWGQMTVAFLIATVESAIRLWAPVHIAVHAPYYALTLMGPSANLIEIYLQWRAKKDADAAKKASGDDTAEDTPPATVAV
jgi:Na+-translocating ferredoxin:NAD+ oxidoreductase RnfD subunit